MLRRIFDLYRRGRKILDEEHYEGENLLYTAFCHTKKYSSEMQMELEQFSYEGKNDVFDCITDIG